MGGAEFVGFNIGQRLIECNYCIPIFDNLSVQIYGENAIEKSDVGLTIKCVMNSIDDAILNKKSLESAMGDDQIFFVSLLKKLQNRQYLILLIYQKLGQSLISCQNFHLAKDCLCLQTGLKIKK